MIITPILVIFLIIVFGLTLLFMNTIDHRKWITVPLSLILTPFLYFYGFYPLLNIFSSYHHQKYFNAEVWTDNPEFRYEMYNHLQRSDTLLGQSKASVEILLGSHEWLSWDDAKKDYDHNRWNYGLGTLPGAFNTKTEALEITFKNDSVSKVSTFKQEIQFDDKK